MIEFAVRLTEYVVEFLKGIGLRFLVAMLLVVSAATPALAHDFWLQPLHFNIPPKTSTSLTVLVGHGPFRSRWSGRAWIASF